MVNPSPFAISEKHGRYNYLTEMVLNHGLGLATKESVGETAAGGDGHGGELVPGEIQPVWTPTREFSACNHPILTPMRVVDRQIDSY